MCGAVQGWMAMRLEPNARSEAPRPSPSGKAAAAAARPAVRPGDARQARFAQAFTQIVAVLMRDRNFRSMPLADLEWLVLPAVMSGQFRLAQAPSPLGRV